jgi:hypothetical protein
MSNVPFVVNPFLYINGLQISNNATTPNTKCDIAVGQCRDSTDTYQLTASSALVIDAATHGLNGLDTGSLAASTLYAVYLVADPVTLQATGAMVSLSATSPLLPLGYSAFRLIGHIATDASSHFLKGYWYGSNSSRLFMYDAPQATSITAGAATSYTGVDLTTLVPAVANTPVWIYSDLLPGNAAGDKLYLQGYNSTGDQVIITGQITTVHETRNSLVMAQLNSAAPSIKYKVTNAGDTAVLKVAGYQFTI